MTIILPRYARRKPGLWIWKTRRKIRKLIHGYRRNPDCNERRRYRDDTLGFTSEHTHKGTWSVPGHSGIGEIVSVPFRPMRFDGPTYSNGLALKPDSDADVLSSWNWFEGETDDD